MKKNKMIAAGHICLDITPRFPETRVPLDRLLLPGRLVQMGEADIHVGGSVSNTGLALQFLGADVALMGKVGKDAFGKLVMDELNRHGAGRGMRVDENSATAYSVVLAPAGVDRIFLHHSGANDTFCAGDLDYGFIEEARLFHFGYPPLMKALYAHDGAGLAEMLRRVKESGAAVSLDMAAVDESSPAGKADWERILGGVLPYVDFFVPSAEELAFMLDKPLYRKWRERAAGGDICSVLEVGEVDSLAQKALNMGAKVVLVKCGATGMYLAAGHDVSAVGAGTSADSGSWDLSSWAGARRFEKSYKPDRVLSGTGAGDASIAAFLYAAVLGKGFEECLRLATATGACCVTEYDALSGLKPFSELERRIAAGWEKV